MTGDLTSRRVFCVLVALGCALAYWTIGYRMLGTVHPGEDAYILFRYADHIAAGRGIVFNSTGPHAEGATDFLWLLLLAAGVRLGADVAFVALTLNACGAAIAGWVIARGCWGPEQRLVSVRVMLSVVIPTVVLAGGALAGYGGFSSMLYSALILGLFVLSAEAPARALPFVPVLGLIIALFRPDGVIIGVSAVILGLWRAWSERRLRPSYLYVSAACAAVGAFYALWRWQYFGLPLPLPLYVKQNGVATTGWSALFPGLRSNLEWLLDPTGPLLIVAVLVVVLVLVRGWREPALVRIVVFMLPVGLLLTALAFAVQTQNVAFRFQGPAFLVLLYALLEAAATYTDRRRAHAYIAAAAVATVVTLPNVANAEAIGLRGSGAWRTYIEALAPRFGPLIPPQTVIAVTEAGAVPYWTDAQVADIVGLNYPPAALRPLTVDDIRRLNPDVVFLHQGTSLDNEVLIPRHERGPRMHLVSSQRLSAALLPSRRAVVKQLPKTYADVGLLNVQYAATLLIEYLSESSDYDIVVVDPGGNQSYLHVWAFKRDWPLKDDALRSIEWALEMKNYRSYRDIRKEHAHTRVATAAAF